MTGVLHNIQYSKKVFNIFIDSNDIANFSGIFYVNEISLFDNRNKTTYPNAKDGHLLSLGLSPTIPKMVNYQNKFITDKKSDKTI